MEGKRRGACHASHTQIQPQSALRDAVGHNDEHNVRFLSRPALRTVAGRWK